jgi:hypothetical protein
MTLLPSDNSGSTSVERQSGDTAGVDLRLLSHAKDLGLLAKRVFRENADTERTVKAEMPDDAEIDLIALNRKNAATFPKLYLDLPWEESGQFVSLQKWEGYVIEVSNNSFAARLVDLTNAGEEEEATFSLRRVSADDRLLVRPGAVFYWNIGEHTDTAGRQGTLSQLRFRRLPAVSDDDMTKARREGKELHDWITGPADQT